MEVVSHTRFLDPAAVMTAAGIAQGDKVADFGCAAGYFSLPCAQIVGEHGTVTAIDVLPQVLESIESKARLRGLRCITTKRANLEVDKGSGLEDAAVDWVILKNVLFMSDDRAAMLAEASRVLRDGGKVLIVEWNEKIHTIGPSAEQRIDRDAMKELLTATGFKNLQSIAAGDYHYSIVAEK